MIVQQTVQVTIDASQSLSNALNLLGGEWLPVGITMPAAWTAAGLTFQGSMATDGTFVDIHTASAELSVTVTASRYYILDPANFQGLSAIKIRSGTGATPVAQASARVITVHLVNATAAL